MKQAIISSLLDHAVALFEENGIVPARVEAEILLSHVLNRPRIDFLVRPDLEVDNRLAGEFEILIHKRCARIPTAYLIGEQEFMSMPFSVSPAVLIPRRETEILVQEVLSRLGSTGNIYCLDMGTGSGCIPVSVISSIGGGVMFTAVDISAEALEVARSNSRLHNIEHLIDFVRSDMFDGLEEGTRYDCITANLPYVSSSEIPGLMAEVRDHEPAEALEGGEDGLHYIRILLDRSPAFLKPGGYLFIETGHTQAREVAAYASENPVYTETEIICDYSRIERVVVVRKGEV